LNTTFDNIVLKQINEVKEKFDQLCELIVFDFSANNIINILNNDHMNKKLVYLLNEFKSTNRLKEFYYFKDKININETSAMIPGKSIDFLIKEYYPNMFKYFYKSEEKYFLYIILEYSEPIELKKYENLIRKIKELFEDCSIRNRTFSSLYCRGCEEIIFHSICKSIYFHTMAMKKNQMFMKNLKTHY